jgi:hypothetical protein
MELKLPTWASAPPAGYPGAVQPPAPKAAAGWQNGEEPPAGTFNWVFQAVSDVSNEVANAIVGAGHALDAARTDQLLAAIQTLIGRAQLKTALTTLRVIHDTAVGPQTLAALARAPGAAGRAIAVGTAATIQANGGPHTNFAAQTAAAPFTSDFNDITYDPTLGLFIAVGKAGEIQTSTGNGTWTRRATGGTHFRKVLTNGLGLCVAVGEQNLIKYSTEGTTWNTASAPPPFGSRTHSGLACGAGVFVSVTESSDIASSLDGSTWTVRRDVDFAGGSGVVVYDQALGFIFAGDSSEDVYRSADGLAWTKIHDQVSVNGLVGSPYGWLGMAASPDGTSVEGRYSSIAVDQPADFIVDYLTSDQIRWMKFIDGQLWALGGTKIYLGGVL